MKHMRPNIIKGYFAEGIPPVPFIRSVYNPYAGPAKKPVHTRGAFAFPDIDLNRYAEMDGWAALKILNTVGHPQREIVQRRVRLVTRRVGERFIKLKLLETAAHSVPDIYFEDQYVDPDALGMGEFDLTDWEAQTGKCGRGWLPEPEETQAAYEQALEEITMLKLCRYKVSYWTGLGYKERWPKIGDLVDIPQDLHADLETIEPLEDRMDAANHRYDDRWFDNHAPSQLGFTADPELRRIILADLVNDAGIGYSILADRKRRSMWEVALWKMEEFGSIEVREVARHRYNLKADLPGGYFSAAALSSFFKWAFQQRFAHWEWAWLTNQVFVWHAIPETWTQEEFRHPRRKFNWRRAV